MLLWFCVRAYLRRTILETRPMKIELCSQSSWVHGEISRWMNVYNEREMSVWPFLIPASLSLGLLVLRHTCRMQTYTWYCKKSPVRLHLYASFLNVKFRLFKDRAISFSVYIIKFLFQMASLWSLLILDIGIYIYCQYHGTQGKSCDSALKPFLLGLKERQGLPQGFWILEARSRVSYAEYLPRTAGGLISFLATSVNTVILSPKPSFLSFKS